jgi:hypothetical protein
LLLAVVRSQISPPPSANSAPAAALNVAQDFFSLEGINRKLARMMTGPIAFALAEAIDKQLANAVARTDAMVTVPAIAIFRHDCRQ